MKNCFFSAVLLFIACAGLCLITFCGNVKECVSVEKRIALLDLEGESAGSIVPGGGPAYKVHRTIGGEKRMCMVLKNGSCAVFDGLPVHSGARLSLLLGASGPGKSMIRVRICVSNGPPVKGVGKGAFKEDAVYELCGDKPGWHHKAIGLDGYAGRRMRVVFEAPDTAEAVEAVVGNPVLLSDGTRVTADEYPPIVLDEVVEDWVAGFDKAELIRSNPDRKTDVYPMSLDREIRTAADEQKKVIAAMPDSAFSFTLTPLEGAYLEVALLNLPLGERTAKDAGDVEYTVYVDNRPEVRVLSDFINVQPGVHIYNRFIHHETIDLSPWAGCEKKIRFETRRIGQGPPSPNAYAWWDIVVKRKVRIPRRRASPDSPNVLVLCVDALRADHLGCYGYERETSPNLDAFSRDALLFEQAMSSCSWTLPATASLLTGLHPNTHGVLGNTRNYLVDGITTLPEYLAWRGVTTAAFSANHLVCQAINFDQGFERFVEKFESAEGVNRDLFGWLESAGPFQFFGYVHYMEPHSPYSAPGKHRQHFDPDYVEERDFSGALPEKWRRGQVDEPFTPEESEHLVSLYDSEIRYWDLRFGHLLDVLEELSIMDRTLIIITADHGEEFFDHSGLGHGVTLYNECIQVPLIIRDPRMKKGVRVSETVSTTSIFNSVTDILGFEKPGFTQVDSLYPIRGLSSRFDEVFSSTESSIQNVQTRLASVIRGPLKLIKDIQRQGGSAELYDLKEDPLERSDLTEERKEGAARLEKSVLAWYESTAKAFPKEWQPLTPEILERLEELGYIAPGDR